MKEVKLMEVYNNANDEATVQGCGTGHFSKQDTDM